MARSNQRFRPVDVTESDSADQISPGPLPVPAEVDDLRPGRRDRGSPRRSACREGSRRRPPVAATSGRPLARPRGRTARIGRSVDPTIGTSACRVECRGSPSWPRSSAGRPGDEIFRRAFTCAAYGPAVSSASVSAEMAELGGQHGTDRASQRQPRPQVIDQTSIRIRLLAWHEDVGVLIDVGVDLFPELLWHRLDRHRGGGCRASVGTNCRRPIGRSSPTGTPLRVTTKSSPRSSARMISPLWLRNSRWVSSRVIRAQRSTRATGPGGRRATWQSPGRVGSQRAEQGAALGDPAEAALQHADRESAAPEIANGEGQQGPVGGDVGPQHRSAEAGPEPCRSSGWTRAGGRWMTTSESRATVAAAETTSKLVGLGRDREVADLAAGGDAQLGRWTASRSSSAAPRSRRAASAAAPGRRRRRGASPGRRRPRRRRAPRPRPASPRHRRPR